MTSTTSVSTEARPCTLVWIQGSPSVSVSLQKMLGSLDCRLAPLLQLRSTGLATTDNLSHRKDCAIVYECHCRISGHFEYSKVLRTKCLKYLLMRAIEPWLEMSTGVASDRGARPTKA